MIIYKVDSSLPWKHWETDNEVYCVEQWTYFVHYIPINKFIIRELQKSAENINRMWKQERDIQSHISTKYKHKCLASWIAFLKHEKQDHLYLVSYAGHLIEHTPRQLCPEIKCTEHATRTCPNLDWIYLSQIWYIQLSQMNPDSFIMQATNYTFKLYFSTWLIGSMSCQKELIDGCSQLVKLHNYCHMIW